MNKIEKIKAEIERLIEMNKTKNGFPAGTMCAVRIETYEKLLSFIGSLPAETSGDLEEAAWGYVQDRIDAAGHPGWDWEKQDVKDAYIAGANWQKEQETVEWSEGDETRLTNIIIMLEEYLVHHYSKDNIDTSVAWLKSLRGKFKED